MDGGAVVTAFMQDVGPDNPQCPSRSLAFNIENLVSCRWPRVTRKCKRRKKWVCRTISKPSSAEQPAVLFLTLPLRSLGIESCMEVFLTPSGPQVLICLLLKSMGVLTLAIKNSFLSRIVLKEKKLLFQPGYFDTALLNWWLLYQFTSADSSSLLFFHRRSFSSSYSRIDFDQPWSNVW